MSLSPGNSSREDGEKPLSKRSVVSCFIFKFGPDGSARVALFRRSGKVRTYQHLLAPISGSVDDGDRTPLAAAWRELAEETQLTAAHLELLRVGKSYKFADQSVGREWTIYPFAFALRAPERDEAAIRTDWEHEGWGWHDPLQIGDGFADGVPRLAESLRRVWFEADLGVAAGGVLARGLARLKVDHQSGARQLAGAALRLFRDVVAQLDGSGQDYGRWWAQVRTAAWHIWKNGRESMGAAILAVLLRALRDMEEEVRQQTQQGPEPRRGWQALAVEELDRIVAERESHGADNGVIQSFVGYLEEHFTGKLESGNRPVSVLTLSDSSTIRLVLQHVVAATDFALDLRILESRPLFEGVALAESLTEAVLASEKGQPRGLASATESTQDAVDSSRQQAVAPKLGITIYSDASAALAASGVDLVVIGADRISASGAVSNKTGSLPAILSARHVAAKSRVVVVSDSDKIAPPGEPHEHVVEDNGGEQLRRSWAVGFNHERVRRAAERLSSRAVGGGVGVGVGSVHVAVSNVFFEWVGAELIDDYVSERGVLSVDGICEASKRLGDEVERMFGAL